VTSAPIPKRIERTATMVAFLVLVDGLATLWALGVTSVRHLVGNAFAPYVTLWGLALLLFKGSRRLVYFPDDLHWTVEGHRIAAEAIAGAIAPLLHPRRP
jgi:hypothetical protein